MTRDDGNSSKDIKTAIKIIFLVFKKVKDNARLMVKEMENIKRPTLNLGR